LGARPPNVENELAEASWELLWEQGPEMLKISLQRLPETHFGARAQKY